MLPERTGVGDGVGVQAVLLEIGDLIAHLRGGHVKVAVRLLEHGGVLVRRPARPAGIGPKVVAAEQPRCRRLVAKHDEYLALERALAVHLVHGA